MPTLLSTHPAAALPGGELQVTGSGLTPPLAATVAGVPATVLLARPAGATLQVPEGALPGDLILTSAEGPSNSLHVQIAILLAENLHPVANPAVDRNGAIYATLSGSRGQQTPVSVFRITPGPEGTVAELRPYVREILNPSGLAFGPDGLLYVSSRADGTIYRVGATGKTSLYAEGLGIVTGIAFDANGDLYAGDRSGTIFKIVATTDPEGEPSTDIFVFATLEPSISAYHLAFASTGVLYVTGPTTASSQPIHAIAPDGSISTFFTGVGRPQGLTFDADDNLYVAASLQGNRGVLRITPAGEAELLVSGNNIVGLCMLADGRAAVATRNAVYEVTLT